MRTVPMSTMLALGVSGCTPFGPDTDSVSFSVVMDNGTDAEGAGPAVDAEMAMQFLGRGADVEWVLTRQETSVLQPGETQVLDYRDGQLNGQAQFEAREPGSPTVLAAATCMHREDRDGADESRRVELRGEASGAVGYTLTCVSW